MIGSRLLLTALMVLSVSIKTIKAQAQVADIGIVEQVSGYARIERDRNYDVKANFGIQSYDKAETEAGRMGITFIDDSKIRITEHSKVVIDEFVFDPNPDNSKLALNFVKGTARFTSGRLGMVPKQNIDLSTPTAQIAVRGTDFTTTIDELGRTLVILLPDKYGGPSGVIDVFNDGGSVTLDQAFQATMVSSYDSPPVNPITISNITINMIDNMFIVNPPTEVQKAIEEAVQDDLEQDKGLLDVDFLEFNELEGDAGLSQNELDEFREIDINALDVDFLPDLLDVIEELIRTTEKLEDAQQVSGAFRLDGAIAGFNKDSQYNIFEEDGDVVFYRSVNGTIRLQLEMDSSVRLDTFTETWEGTILLNGGDDIIIVITQRN